LAESLNQAKQMAVHRPYEKAIGGNQRPPPVVINAPTAGMTLTVSPLTNQMGATPGIAVVTVGNQSSSPPSTQATPSSTRMRPKLQLTNKEINMPETYLRRYAAVQKRNAVAAILDYTDEEWESLKALKGANAVERSQTALANDINSGALVMKKETLGGTIDKGMA
jgi:hypothetical protein